MQTVPLFFHARIPFRTKRIIAGVTKCSLPRSASASASGRIRALPFIVPPNGLPFQSQGVTRTYGSFSMRLTFQLVRPVMIKGEPKEMVAAVTFDLVLEKR